MMKAPLKGLLVIDLSQFLAGPYASLRLQDLGARVIKIERPDGGDLSRRLYLSDTMIGGDSTMFHAINRGKESLVLDLKSAADRQALLKLVSQADVLIQNFRPGVIERLGLDYETVSALAPRLIYGSVSGYGSEGEWASRPGQDLLAQARSGVMWLSGNADQGPVPLGLPVADLLSGANLAQALLAGLVGRGVSGKGCLVETSLLESLIDLQFEVLTTYFNDGNRPPRRSASGSAHIGLAAPYGVYRTLDGWLALAMTPLATLASLLSLPGLDDPSLQPFADREVIRDRIAARLLEMPTSHWLSALEPSDIWCAEVLDWDRLAQTQTFGLLDMIGRAQHGSGSMLNLMRAPIRINGERATADTAAPAMGAHTQAIRREFGL